MGNSTKRFSIDGKELLIPSHLLNETGFDFLEEAKTSIANKVPFNWGDMVLFKATRPARDAFLIGGRKTLGNSIRNLLEINAKLSGVK